ncbi:MAG: hypothetical protein K4571_12475 [Deltaproteobacteria bacterium]
MKKAGINQKGSVLITLVIAMTITAVLGAGMVYLTSTSTLSELFSSSEGKAYYVAEGGARYAVLLRESRNNFKAYSAASPYRDTFTLNDDDGRFELEVYYDPATDKIFIKSTGIASNASWMQTRSIVSKWIRPISVPSFPPPDEMADAPAAGEFVSVDVGGDAALKIVDTTSGSTAEAYVAVPPGASNPFYVAWNAAGGFLSYDSQVKVTLGIWSEWLDMFIYRPENYCMGFTSQHRQTTSVQQNDFYGLSIVRTHNAGGSGRDNIPDTMIPTGVANNTPMIVFWVRNGNQGDGADYWLAYQVLSTSDYIISTYSSWPSIHPWSTLYLRLVEAASIKLSVTDAPLISVGGTINGATGTGKVVKKIKDSDNRVVLLLNNITGTFTRPAAVNGYGTDAAWGYRSKDNYYWAFYGDPSAHGVANANPLDNIRLANPRSGTLAWAVSDMADWTAAKDNFRLVQWNAALNTSTNGDPSVKRMGQGNELNAIIRTNKLVTANTYSPVTNFPAMIGLVCVGDSCDGELEWGWSAGYYDDLAYLIAGSNGSSGEVQY